MYERDDETETTTTMFSLHSTATTATGTATDLLDAMKIGARLSVAFNNADYVVHVDGRPTAWLVTSHQAKVFVTTASYFARVGDALVNDDLAWFLEYDSISGS